MQVHTLDKAALINELTVGNGMSHAVHQRRRADFSLMLAMFSGDVRDNTPVEHIDEVVTSDDLLRQRFQLPSPQALRNDQSSYAVAQNQASLFHAASLASAKLSHYLTPDALTYLPEDTHNLPEEVYHNLSGHDRRHLAQPEPVKSLPADLYQQLNTAMRCDQIRAQA